MTTDRGVLSTTRAAECWLSAHGLALRYTGKSVPLPSLRAACGPDTSKAALTRSIELTNHLLGRGLAIEVTVIAGGRLVLIDRALMPAVYTLARRGRPLNDLSGLSLDARRALALVGERREVSVGDVRRFLGRPAQPRLDPGAVALGELQRAVLVDRGPFEIPEKGIPYLPREGYPYHLFHEAHADLVASAKRLSVPAAADRLIRALLGRRDRLTRRQLFGIVRLLLSVEEMDAAVSRAGIFL